MEPKVLEWAKGSISLIPSSVLTEAECSCFLKCIADVASGSDSRFSSRLEEYRKFVKKQDCSRHSTGELRQLDLHFTAVS
ncbi:hypothetical protein HPP92_025644 [Vanilla planifolia]|uniref:Uncharacterized protein n=1 Tax=Vanilla planifolia TaxID=51239 RepID=A0A835U9J5_VANPL|nr:hypothetical protein HPP92_025644 [Vanilla planifolia]